MKRNRQENDPQRDRSSRNERSGELGHVGEDARNHERDSDLERQQSEGNLGNERTRNREQEGGDRGGGNRRDEMGDNRDL
jgi:hypothetical protein